MVRMHEVGDHVTVSDPVSLHPFTRISDHLWCTDMCTKVHIVVVRRYRLWDYSFVCGCCKDWRKGGGKACMLKSWHSDRLHFSSCYMHSQLGCILGLWGVSHCTLFSAWTVTVNIYCSSRVCVCVCVCVWLGDEELTQAVSSLPSRESLQGFKMFPLDFEKVWHRYIVQIHMYICMLLHNNTHSHEVSLMGKQRNRLQHQNVTQSVPKLSKKMRCDVSWDRGEN